MRFELTTPTLARLCSTTELRPLKDVWWAPLNSEARPRGGIWQKLCGGASLCFGFYDILLPARIFIVFA